MHPLLSSHLLVPLNLILDMFPTNVVLSASTDRRMCQVDVTVVTVIFGHISLLKAGGYIQQCKSCPYDQSKWF